MGCLAIAAVALSCVPDATGPSGPKVMRGFTVLTQLAGGTLPPGAASALVPFTRVRIVLRSGGVSTVDRVAEFPPTATELPFAVDVPVLSGSDTGDVQDLTLAYINAGGDTVFRGGPTPVRVLPTRAGREPPAPPRIQVRYTGTGATATRVRILQRADSVLSGNSFTLTAVAEDAQQQPVAAPIAWSSLDTALANPTTPTAGSGTTRAGRGPARIVAQLLTGQADTVSLVLRPRPQTLALVSGGGQSGTQGQPLPQPVVVRVTATDGLPVAGVSVFFATGTNSGSPSTGTAVTDANGLAQVSWTLGVGLTVQTLIVTASGLTGSPLNVLATPPPLATQLAFGVQPGAVVAGAAIAPAITVRAETGAGALVTTYTGPVTIAIGNGPAGATLGGTLTVNAVDGIATFSGLTLPRAGTGYALVATAAGLTAAQSGTFTVAPAPAATLQFSTSPADANASAILVPSPTVTAFDAFGNVATGFTGSVSLAFGANPGAATLAGTTTVAAVAGVAAFPGLSIANAGVGYTLVASAAGLASATSAAFTIVSTTSLNSWTNAAGGTWSTAANWSLGRAPIGTDSVVIALPGTYTVTMDVNFTGTHLAVGGGTGVQTLAVGPRALTLSGSHRVLPSGALTMAAGGIIGGAGALQNAGTITLGGGTISAPLTNSGQVVANGSPTISTISANAPSGVIEVRPVGAIVATLTVSTSFTNSGTILLTNSGSAGGVAVLQVPAGQTLTNAGRIRTLLGAGSGQRNLNAAVVNQDTIDVRQFPLSMVLPTGSAWVNQATGVIRADSVGDITITANGSTISNAGTILLGARTFTQGGGTLNLTAGILSGDAGTLVTNGVTLNLNLANSRTRYNFGSPGSTLASALTIPAGDSLRTVGGSLTTTPGFTINGRLVALGSTTVSGVSLPTGGTMEVRPVGATVTTLTVNTSFTNNGTILLTNSGGAGGVAQLVLPAGQTLTNAGRIRSLVGAGAGQRTLNATVVNQDTVDVRQFDLSLVVPTGSTWLNEASGVIRADSVGDLAVTATSATVTNLGTILTGARTFTQTGGTLNLTAGSLLGDAGTLVTNGVTLNLALANSRTRYNFGSPGTTLGSALTIPAGDSLRVVGGGLTTTPGLTINGRLVALGTSTFSGFVLPASGTVEVRPVGAVVTTLTVNTGFTNAGTILLTNSVSAGGVAQLVLPAGQTLTNAGRIRTLVGAGGGSRSVNAAVVNQDTLDVRQFGLTLAVPSGATWLNEAAGVIRADSVGDIAVTATSATVTNLGTILTGARTFTQTGGTLNLTAGSLLGDAGTLVTNGVTLNLNLANSRTRYNFGSPASTLGAALTIPVGDSLRVVGGGLTTTPGFTINGRLVALGSATFSGVSLPAGGTVEVRPVGAVVTTLTVNTSFTNAGTILLTNSVSAGGVAQLVMPSGQTLTNAGRIRTLLGAGGGSRTINATVVNQDTIDVRQFDLNLTVPSGTTWENQAAGVVRADSVGDVTVAATGATFTNLGTILAGARTFTQTGGTLNLTAGSFSGETGTLVTNSVTALNLNLANVRTRFNFGSPGSTLASALTIPVGDSLRVVGGSLTTTPGFTINGRLVALGSATFSGVSLPASGTMEVRPVGAVVTTLTVNTSFTNAGTILLTNSVSAGGVAQLVMPSGQTLTNAGRIRTLLGAGGGSRTINATVVNQDTIDVRQFDLNLTVPSGTTWENQAAGVVRADSVGDLNVTATGATVSNTGTILMGARTFTQTGGTLNLIAGSLSGDAGTLATSNLTLNLNLANARTRYNFGSPATTLGTALTIPAGDSLRILGGSLTTTPGLTINGRLVALGGATLSALTLPAGGTLEVRPVGAVVTRLTVNTGFTNNGTILLTNSVSAGGVSELQLPAGQTLVNAGRIRSLVGATGGSRTLNASVVNQDTIDVRQFDLNLTIPGGGTWTNDVSGVIRADSVGDITASANSATFTNTGTILMGARTYTQNGGTLNLTAGSVSGEAGTVAMNSVTSLNVNLANVRTRFNFGPFGSTLGSPLTIPAGDSLRVVTGNLNTTAGFTINGRLVVLGNTTLSGLTLPAGGTVEVRPVGAVVTTLTVSSSFTNNGTILLTNSGTAGGVSVLSMPAGQTLTNAGTLQTTAGAGGGSRTLTAPLVVNNAGANITVAAGLTLNGALDQGGTLTVNGGAMPISGLTRLLSGSFTTAPNGTLTFTGGCSNQGGAVGVNVPPCP